MSAADAWQVVLYLHLLAMAFFVGGQLFLGVVVVPQARRHPGSIEIGPIARGFGIGSLVALAILVATGAALADHYSLWGSPTLQAKLALLGVVIVLALAHLRRPQAHLLQAAILLLTLAISYLGVDLALGG